MGLVSCPFDLHKEYPRVLQSIWSSPNGRVVGLVSIGDLDVQEGRKCLALGRPRNQDQGVTNTNLRRAPGLGFVSSVERPMEKLNLRYNIADHETWRY